MKSDLVFCVFLTFVVSAVGQTTQAPKSKAPPAAEAGVASEWDARKLIDALSEQAAHLKPIIDQVKPETWKANSAKATYVAQWNDTQAQLKYTIDAANAFARDPEQLPLGLDMYFRMEATDSMLRSLSDAVRKYQNPALALIMQSVVAENSTNRDKLRQYLRDLADEKEQEFQVADREAQRCRAAVIDQPAPNSRKVSRR